MEVPALGFGTWPMRGDTCRRAVEYALNIGYRHIDTAQMYNNEATVGRAIAGSGVPRKDVLLVTKILRENLAYDDVLRSVEESAQRLGTEIEFLLIHAPSRTVPIEESISAMNELQELGTVDDIGGSNFSVEQLRQAKDASDTPILTNQVENHPFKSQSDLLEHCIENWVMLTAYSPLGKGRVTGNETLEAIGATYEKTAVQVGLRWLLQQEMVAAIPKASSPAHVEVNVHVFDFELTHAEMEQVFEMQGGLVSRLRSHLGL